MAATCQLTIDEYRQLKRLAGAFDAAAADLKGFLDDLQGAWEEAFIGRSERWQESEAGSEAQDRLAIVTEWCGELASFDDVDRDVEQLA